jgi:Xaa-Pro aminopeptidase
MSFGHHKYSARPVNEHQKALRYTQTVVNAMIRERDAGKACITCEKFLPLSAGHFKTSTNAATQYHPHNLHGQCNSCNGYNGGMTWEYGKAIVRMYGKGYDDFLTKIARPKEIWTTEELEQLRSAARMGHNAYIQFYKTLRPHHFPIMA